MKHFVRLAFLTLLVFAAMSSYFLGPRRGDWWEEASRYRPAGTDGPRRLGIFFSEKKRSRKSATAPSSAAPVPSTQADPSFPRGTSGFGLPRAEAFFDETGSAPGRGGPAGLEGKREPQVGGSRPRIYIVKKGDTLTEISARMLGSIRFLPYLLKANPSLKDRNQLRVGQRLILPTDFSDSQEQAGKSGSGGAVSSRKKGKTEKNGREKKQESIRQGYREIVVKKGDTWYGFAKRFLGAGSKWPRLVELNRTRVKDPKKLAPGMRILVPLKRKGG